MKQSPWGFASASDAGPWRLKSGSWEGKVTRRGEAQTHIWGWGRSCKDVWSSDWTLNYLQASRSVMQVICRISRWLSPTEKRAPGPGAREADIGGDLAGSGGAVGAPQQPAETPDLQWHVPVSAFEQKESMAASFLPSESQTKFLFWPKPTVKGTEFWEM